MSDGGKEHGTSSCKEKESENDLKYSEISETAHTKGKVPSKRALKAQARKWHYLQNNVRNAMEELYRQIEIHGNEEQCSEALLYLAQCRHEFVQLIERFQYQKEYEQNPQFYNSVSWEVRKSMNSFGPPHDSYRGAYQASPGRQRRMEIPPAFPPMHDYPNPNYPNPNWLYPEQAGGMGLDQPYHPVMSGYQMHRAEAHVTPKKVHSAEDTIASRIEEYQQASNYYAASSTSSGVISKTDAAVNTEICASSPSGLENTASIQVCTDARHSSVQSEFQKEVAPASSTRSNTNSTPSPHRVFSKTEFLQLQPRGLLHVSGSPVSASESPGLRTGSGNKPRSISPIPVVTTWASLVGSNSNGTSASVMNPPLSDSISAVLNQPVSSSAIVSEKPSRVLGGNEGVRDFPDTMPNQRSRSGTNVSAGSGRNRYGVDYGDSKHSRKHHKGIAYNNASGDATSTTSSNDCAAPVERSRSASMNKNRGRSIDESKAGGASGGKPLSAMSPSFQIALQKEMRAQDEERRLEYEKVWQEAEEWLEAQAQAEDRAWHELDKIDFQGSVLANTKLSNSSVSGATSVTGTPTTSGDYSNVLSASLLAPPGIPHSRGLSKDRNIRESSSVFGDEFVVNSDIALDSSLNSNVNTYRAKLNLGGTMRSGAVAPTIVTTPRVSTTDKPKSVIESNARGAVIGGVELTSSDSQCSSTAIAPPMLQPGLFNLNINTDDISDRSERYRNDRDILSASVTSMHSSPAASDGNRKRMSSPLSAVSPSFSNPVTPSTRPRSDSIGTNATTGSQSATSSHYRSLHEKLSSPDRKKTLSPENARIRQEQKQLQAEINRDRNVQEKKQKAHDLGSGRVRNSEEKYLKKQMQANQSMELRMQEAGMRRDEYIKSIRDKATNENAKVSEVAFINSMNGEELQYILQQKLQDAEKRINAVTDRRKANLEKIVGKHRSKHNKIKAQLKLMKANHEERLLERWSEMQNRIGDVNQRRELRLAMIQKRTADLILIPNSNPAMQGEPPLSLSIDSDTGQCLSTPATAADSGKRAPSAGVTTPFNDDTDRLVSSAPPSIIKVILPDNNVTAHKAGEIGNIGEQISAVDTPREEVSNGRSVDVNLKTVPMETVTVSKAALTSKESADKLYNDMFSRNLLSIVGGGGASCVLNDKGKDMTVQCDADMKSVVGSISKDVGMLTYTNLQKVIDYCKATHKHPSNSNAKAQAIWLGRMIDLLKTIVKEMDNETNTAAEANATPMDSRVDAGNEPCGADAVTSTESATTAITETNVASATVSASRRRRNRKNAVKQATNNVRSSSSAVSTSSYCIISNSNKGKNRMSVIKIICLDYLMLVKQLPRNGDIESQKTALELGIGVCQDSAWAGFSSMSLLLGLLFLLLLKHPEYGMIASVAKNDTTADSQDMPESLWWMTGPVQSKLGRVGQARSEAVGNDSLLMWISECYNACLECMKSSAIFPSHLSDDGTVAQQLLSGVYANGSLPCSMMDLTHALLLTNQEWHDLHNSQEQSAVNHSQPIIVISSSPLTTESVIHGGTAGGTAGYWSGAYASTPTTTNGSIFSQRNSHAYSNIGLSYSSILPNHTNFYLNQSIDGSGNKRVALYDASKSSTVSHMNPHHGGGLVLTGKSFSTPVASPSASTAVLPGLVTPCRITPSSQTPAASSASVGSVPIPSAYPPAEYCCFTANFLDTTCNICSYVENPIHSQRSDSKILIESALCKIFGIELHPCCEEGSMKCLGKAVSQGLLSLQSQINIYLKKCEMTFEQEFVIVLLTKQLKAVNEFSKLINKYKEFSKIKTKSRYIVNMDEIRTNPSLLNAKNRDVTADHHGELQLKVLTLLSKINDVELVPNLTTLLSVLVLQSKGKSNSTHRRRHLDSSTINPKTSPLILSNNALSESGFGFEATAHDCTNVLSNTIPKVVSNTAANPSHNSTPEVPRVLLYYCGEILCTLNGLISTDLCLIQSIVHTSDVQSILAHTIDMLVKLYCDYVEAPFPSAPFNANGASSNIGGGDISKEAVVEQTNAKQLNRHRNNLQKKKNNFEAESKEIDHVAQYVHIFPEVEHLLRDLEEGTDSQTGSAGVDVGSVEHALHNVMKLIGYVCVDCMELQKTMFTGSKSSTLLKLCQLPVRYISQDFFKYQLFPTLITLCMHCADNYNLFKREMSPLLIKEFITNAIESVEQEEGIVTSNVQSDLKTEATPNRRNDVTLQRNSELSRRIPFSMWRDVEECFSK